MSITMSSHTTFFTAARQSKSKYTCEKEWARHFARAYYHEIDANPGFLTIYNKLLSGLEDTRGERSTQPSTQPSIERRSKRITKSSTMINAHASVEQQNVRVTRSSTRSSAEKANTFVKAGEQTEVERKRGKYELNCILYKEYNDWHDAFEAEAKEDEGVSADDRWSWHAAKALSRKTGVSADALVPVVQAWLLEKS